MLDGEVIRLQFRHIQRHINPANRLQRSYQHSLDVWLMRQLGRFQQEVITIDASTSVSILSAAMATH